MDLWVLLFGSTDISLVFKWTPVSFLYAFWINFVEFWDLLFGTVVKHFCTIETFCDDFLGLP